MRRRLLNALAGVSTLLCAAVIVLWGRSYMSFDELDYTWIGPTPADATAAGVYSFQGQLLIGSVVHEQSADFEHLGWSWSSGQPFVSNGSYLTRLTSNWTKFAIVSEPRFVGQTFSNARAVAVPHWFVALLFALLPTLMVRQRLRAYGRQRAGLCPKCGYDLRATPGRCPECGAVPSGPGLT